MNFLLYYKSNFYNIYYYFFELLKSNKIFCSNYIINLVIINLFYEKYFLKKYSKKLYNFNDNDFIIFIQEQLIFRFNYYE